MEYRWRNPTLHDTVPTSKMTQILPPSPWMKCNWTPSHPKLPTYYSNGWDPYMNGIRQKTQFTPHPDLCADSYWTVFISLCMNWLQKSALGPPIAQREELAPHSGREGHGHPKTATEKWGVLALERVILEGGMGPQTAEKDALGTCTLVEVWTKDSSHILHYCALSLQRMGC